MTEEQEKEARQEQEEQPDKAGASDGRDAAPTDKDRVGELERTVAEKEAEIARLSQSSGEMEKQITALRDSLAKAVASYKTAVVRANPEVVGELISGEGIEAIDESLARAKELVSKVRQGVEREISLTKVPAGSPERTSSDVSGMTPREKIQYAFGKK